MSLSASVLNEAEGSVYSAQFDSPFNNFEMTFNKSFKKLDITTMLNNHDMLSQDPIFTPEQVLENRGRVAIFIDGSNLFYAALQLGIEIDYTKLLCRLTAGSRLFRAFFYTGVDRTNEKQQGFLLWMRRNGYRVIAKDLVQLPDGSKKANLDVEIAVDMMALVGFYDTAILVSGDGTSPMQLMQPVIEGHGSRL